MAEVRLRFSERGLARATKRLERLLERVGDAESVMAEAAEYMVRSTQSRLYRDKRAPDGSIWAELSETTQAIREALGYSRDNTLVMSGELARSVQVISADRLGFVVEAAADHAAHHQYGVESTRGMIRGKEVPPRPFMGFSETNIRTIARMVNNFIAETVSDSD